MSWQQDICHSTVEKIQTRIDNKVSLFWSYKIIQISLQTLFKSEKLRKKDSILAQKENKKLILHKSFNLITFKVVIELSHLRRLIIFAWACHLKKPKIL